MYIENLKNLKETLEEIIEQEIELFPLEYQIEQALSEIDLNEIVRSCIYETIEYEIDLKEIIVDAVQAKITSMIDERELEEKIREMVNEYIDD